MDKEDFKRLLLTIFCLAWLIIGNLIFLDTFIERVILK
jgi:hypothetical protein